MVEETPPKVSTIPKRMCSTSEGWLAYFFMVFWLVPVMIVAVTNTGFPYTTLTRVGVPRPIAKDVLNFANNMYRISCLFPKRISQWGNYYYLVRREGEREWVSVPVEELSRLKPFGYRSRLKRMLDGIGDKKAAQVRYKAMSQFIKERYEALHPNESPVVAVRIVRVVYLSGSEEIAKPQGSWERPPFHEVRPEQIQLITTQKFETGER